MSSCISSPTATAASCAVIAVHSTHLGPGAGGVRFWHYAEPGDAVADALRLSRGMSYKNAMAGLPLGGGKAVILADEDRTKTPEMLAAFGRAVERPRRPLRHRRGCRHHRRRPGRDLEADPLRRRPAGRRGRGRRRSRAAHQLRRLPRRQGRGEARARQGQPRRPPHRHPGRGQRRRRPRPPRRRGRRADQHRRHRPRPAPRRWPTRSAATVVAPDAIMTLEADVLSPNALGAILDRASRSPRCSVPIVAGGANNQLATPERRRPHPRSAASSTRPIT